MLLFDGKQFAFPQSILEVSPQASTSPKSLENWSDFISSSTRPREKAIYSSTSNGIITFGSKLTRNIVDIYTLKQQNSYAFQYHSIFNKISYFTLNVLHGSNWFTFCVYTTTSPPLDPKMFWPNSNWIESGRIGSSSFDHFLKSQPTRDKPFLKE